MGRFQPKADTPLRLHEHYEFELTEEIRLEPTVLAAVVTLGLIIEITPIPRMMTAAATATHSRVTSPSSPCKKRAFARCPRTNVISLSTENESGGGQASLKPSIERDSGDRGRVFVRWAHSVS